MQPHASHPHAHSHSSGPGPDPAHDDCCAPGHKHDHAGHEHHAGHAHHDHHSPDHHGPDHHGPDHHGHDHHGHDHHAHAAPSGDACDCAGHRLQARTKDGGKASLLATLLPILACALCPVCLSTYAAVLSALGVTLAFTEGQHAVLLAVAVVAALGVGIWKARRSGRYTALALTAAGCGLLVLSQVFNDNRVLGLLGIGALLGSLVYERVQARRAAAQFTPVPVPAVSR
ncbi:MAG: hypothetical protein U1A78_06030 [Polyangia bacterium]